MKAKYEGAFYTNDDLRPMLRAENRLLVAVHPDNEDFDYFITYGRDYGTFVFNSECRKHARLLGQIAVIHPVLRRNFEGGIDEEEGI